jgi:ketosteroid isomerase-like protein
MRIRFCLLAILAVTFFLVSACKDVTSSDDLDRSRIEDIVDGIRDAFNAQDLDAIMDYYHPDYRHKGHSYTQERQIWALRMIDYVDMTIEDVSIDLNGAHATVSFKMTLTNSTDSDLTLEPYENGDFSYFLKEDGFWKVWGDQKDYGNSEGNYNIYVSSTPSEAKIYLDDAPLFQYTPTTLYGLPPANYKLRLYKEGYNEWETVVHVPDDDLVLSPTLTTPALPKPVFNMEEPTEGKHYSHSVGAVRGTITMLHADQSITPFDNDTYILSVNGVEQVVDTLGEVNELLTLRSGLNEIKMRATSTAGNTGTITLHVYGDF